MNCASCNSTRIVRNGFYKTYQKFKCKDCGKQVSERSYSFFCRHRYPEGVIRNAILYGMFVSTRNVAFLIKETIQFYPSNVSIFNWLNKFAKLLIKTPFKSNFSNIWHVDEKFVKVKDSKDDFAYLWVVIDDNNTMIITHVSERRDKDSAKIVFKKALDKAKKPPDIIVSDGLQSYKKAINVFGKQTKHAVAHFEAKGFMHKGKLYHLSNNRIESLNSKINLWYKKHRGFKSIESANQWCEMWMYFYNLMRPRVISHEIVSIRQLIH